MRHVVESRVCVRISELLPKIEGPPPDFRMRRRGD